MHCDVYLPLACNSCIFILVADNIHKKNLFIVFLKTNFFAKYQSLNKFFFTIVYSIKLRFFYLIDRYILLQMTRRNFLFNSQSMCNQVFYDKCYIGFSELESFVDPTKEKKSKLKKPFPSSEAPRSSLSNETSPSAPSRSVLKKSLYAWDLHFAPWYLYISQTEMARVMKILLHLYLYGSSICRKFHEDSMHHVENRFWRGGEALISI